MRSNDQANAAFLLSESERFVYSQPRCWLFQLPREIRDLIYNYYTTTPDGYRYDISLQILVQSDGRPIDLNLSRTCRRIKEEMKGLPMRNNKVVFRTFCTLESSIRAGVLHATLHRLEQAKWYKICTIGRALLTESIQQKVEQEHPVFRPVLNGLLESANLEDIDESPIFQRYAPHSWGQPPSVFRNFLDRLYALLSGHPDWARLASEDDSEIGSLELAGSPPLPWSMLREDRVEQIKNALYPGQDWTHTAFTRPSKNYTFSAAAMAISYLESISSTERKSLRNIELIEDQAAVAFPECHIQGLVQYCQENPALRIRRVASLWKSILPAVLPHSGTTTSLCMLRGRITEQIAMWVTEAAALPTFDMPDHCFTLVLDGQPLAMDSSGLFQLVLEDCANQVAMDTRFEKELLTDRFWLNRRAGDYNWTMQYFVRFPEIMQDIQMNRGPISCNFNLGSGVDAGTLLNSRADWTWDDWQAERLERWACRNTPLPPARYLSTDTAMDWWHSRTMKVPIEQAED